MACPRSARSLRAPYPRRFALDLTLAARSRCRARDATCNTCAQRLTRFNGRELQVRGAAAPGVTGELLCNAAAGLRRPDCPGQRPGRTQETTHEHHCFTS